MSQYWADLEQQEYDPDEFVERLAFRARSGSGGGSELGEAQQLHATFLSAINDLRSMHEKQVSKCMELEEQCREEEKQHWARVAALIQRNKAAATTYKSLDERINLVAGKVVHLGDQLESVNTPRARAVEALKLMKHFDDFLDGDTSVSPVFMDKARLYEAADIIQKLQLIAQELPEAEFSPAQRAIEAKYSEIERCLIEEFVRHHRSDDTARMAELALILSHFRGYNECVNAFIEQIQLTSFRGKDPFKDIVPLCKTSWATISAVFPSPSAVMAKFVLNIYHVKLKEHIQEKLQDKNKTEQYLRHLFQLYSQTTTLSSSLSHYNLGSDQLFLSRLTKDIFSRYLDSYINIESRYLNERSKGVLQRYYDSKGHTRKQISSSGAVSELKRDMAGLIAAKTNFTIGDVVNYGGETFLSEEVAISLLQESKEAFRRCQVLSKTSDLPVNAVEIFNILISYLLHHHVDYALELGLAGIPLPETKQPPELHFFSCVSQTNTIIHLVDKLFTDSLVPLVAGSPKQGDCLHTKKQELEKLESKLDQGLDRSLAAVAGWVRTVLNAEQKKTDFNPVGGEEALPVASTACLKVVRWVAGLTEKLRDCLDGRNVEWVLQELGVRLHRAIYEHLMQFQFASAGAMTLICDMQEYRKCVADWKLGVVTALFDTLHAMCNLLILPPENLRGAAMGDQLASVDKTILDNWLQLRVDYKSARLANCL